MPYSIIYSEYDSTDSESLLKESGTKRMKRESRITTSGGELLHPPRPQSRFFPFPVEECKESDDALPSPTSATSRISDDFLLTDLPGFESLSILESNEDEMNQADIRYLLDLDTFEVRSLAPSLQDASIFQFSSVRKAFRDVASANTTAKPETDTTLKSSMARMNSSCKRHGHCMCPRHAKMVVEDADANAKLAVQAILSRRKTVEYPFVSGKEMASNNNKLSSEPEKPFMPAPVQATAWFPTSIQDKAGLAESAMLRRRKIAVPSSRATDMSISV